jgi:hypothetical protein
MESSSVLLPIFEETPHLSSMNIGENNFQSIFNDNGLHKYLNKRIKDYSLETTTGGFQVINLLE